MDPDLVVEMVNFEFVIPGPLTGTGPWVVRFQAVEGGHCVAHENNTVTGDLEVEPRCFETIRKSDNPNFKDVRISGTQGTWSFECCVHGPDMPGTISVNPD
jgi:hypothetical protein